MSDERSLEPGLWAGATVQWVGTEQEHQGVQIRPGDRATVVDAGLHAIESFAWLRAEGEPGAEGEPEWTGPGVRIEVPSGRQLSVAREHLALVPPDHPLSAEQDGSVADWLLKHLAIWDRGVVTVASDVPRSFPAVCRILHPWTRWDGDQQCLVRWRELAAHTGCTGPRELFRTHQTKPGIVEVGGFEEPSHGQLDEETAVALVNALRPATSTPDMVYFAVWEGWGDIPPQQFPGAARIPTEARGHFLLRGPLSGALTSISIGGGPHAVSGIWWPADRAWVVSTEIDFYWTFVAGSETLISTLVARDDLEATRTGFDSDANQPDPDD